VTQTLYGPRLSDIIEKYGYDLKLDDYPIYDENFRPVLNQRILDHFWLREIGAETIPDFIFYLNRTMRENMPVYNPVFAKLAQDTDLISNVDTTSDSNTNSTSNGENQSTTCANDNSTTDSRTLQSNAPQINMASKNPEDYWNTGAFGHNEGNSTTSNQNTGTNKDMSLATYLAHTKGLNGVLTSDALRAWLDAYVNPLTELFDTLEPCFSQLYTDHYNGL